MPTPLESRLRALIEAQDYDGLLACLDALSNSRFRMAGQLIGERIAPMLPPERFWPLLRVLTSWQPRAFLVTMLKSLARGMGEGRFSVHDDGFRTECQRISTSPIDRAKAARTLLPALDSPEDIRTLLLGMGYKETDTWIPLLLDDLRLPTAFLLLQALRYVEHDRPVLLRVAAHLKQRGDSLSFNMASLMRTMFGLSELGGTFSLRLEPYQLARLEKSYAAFCKVISMR